MEEKSCSFFGHRKIKYSEKLHERVEKTIENLIDMGFDKSVTDAISLMTHVDGVDYMDYVRQIKENPIAKAVKLADIDHNSDSSRLDADDPRIPYWEEKYRRARQVLCE